MRCDPFSPIQKCPQRKALGTSEFPRGAFLQPHMQLDPSGSPFLRKPKYTQAGIRDDLKIGPQKTRYKPISSIQKCPQRKAWGTSELPRGAFTQPHMQLDPPSSLFPSNPKYNPNQHGRRLKTRTPENALRAPFAHPKVPPK